MGLSKQDKIKSKTKQKRKLERKKELIGILIFPYKQLLML